VFRPEYRFQLDFFARLFHIRLAFARFGKAFSLPMQASPPAFTKDWNCSEQMIANREGAIAATA